MGMGLSHSYNNAVVFSSLWYCLVGWSYHIIGDSVTSTMRLFVVPGPLCFFCCSWPPFRDRVVLLNLYPNRVMLRRSVRLCKVLTWGMSMSTITLLSSTANRPSARAHRPALPRPGWRGPLPVGRDVLCYRGRQPAHIAAVVEHLEPLHRPGLCDVGRRLLRGPPAAHLAH